MQCVFTSAIHAAPPHTDGMKKGSSWEGAALPDPPAGGGMGKPGFPMPLLEGCAPQTLPRAVYAHLGEGVPPASRLRGKAARAPRRNVNRYPMSLTPSQGRVRVASICDISHTQEVRSRLLARRGGGPGALHEPFVPRPRWPGAPLAAPPPQSGNRGAWRCGPPRAPPPGTSCHPVRAPVRATR
jgi:hypothetical protein